MKDLTQKHIVGQLTQFMNNKEIIRLRIAMGTQVWPTKHTNGSPICWSLHGPVVYDFESKSISYWENTWKIRHLTEATLANATVPTNIIHFHSTFNQPIDSIDWKRSLHTIVFGEKFNQSLRVGVFPPSLHTIIFGDAFNKPLPVGVFPSSLHTLKFGDYFNQPLVAGVFPPSLRTLNLGILFDQPLDVGVLPHSLHTLDDCKGALTVNVLEQ
jgi:hypothetical protein